jgi:hypothetical protein
MTKRIGVAIMVAFMAAVPAVGQASGAVRPPAPNVLCGNCLGGEPAPPYACNENTGTYEVNWAGGKWYCVQGYWWYDGPA